MKFAGCLQRALRGPAYGLWLWLALARIAPVHAQDAAEAAAQAARDESQSAAKTFPKSQAPEQEGDLSPPLPAGRYVQRYVVDAYERRELNLDPGGRFEFRISQGQQRLRLAGNWHRRGARVQLQPDVSAPLPLQLWPEARLRALQSYFLPATFPADDNSPDAQAWRARQRGHLSPGDWVVVDVMNLWDGKPVAVDQVALQMRKGAVLLTDVSVPDLVNFVWQVPQGTDVDTVESLSVRLSGHDWQSVALEPQLRSAYVVMADVRDAATLDWEIGATRPPDDEDPAHPDIQLHHEVFRWDPTQ